MNAPIAMKETIDVEIVKSGSNKGLRTLLIREVSTFFQKEKYKKVIVRAIGRLS